MRTSLLLLLIVLSVQLVFSQTKIYKSIYRDKIRADEILDGDTVEITNCN